MNELTQYDLRMALIYSGIAPSQIDDLIATMPLSKERESASAAWNFAQMIQRDHPLVSSIAAALNKSQADIDTIFGL